MLETTLQDIRYALRGLMRNPTFAITAIFAAALGIGASTAVFSVVDRILFRPLPYADASRLVSAGMMVPLDSNEFMFAGEYFDLRRDPGPFTEVSAFQAGASACDLTEQNPLRLRCMRLEANFLHMLGLAPAIGRSFSVEEDRPNGPRAAMISHGLWVSRFAGDPLVIGRLLPLDGVPTAIVGVLPREFELPTLTQSDVLLPLALNEATERSGRALRVFARLKPGLTVTQATAQLQPHFERALATVPPQFRKEVKLRVQSVRDRQVGEVRLASLVLFGSVLLVLLIACANIANLLLARAVARERELTMRIALGASRLRLIRQMLTESSILGIIGGAGGCALAYALLRIFIALAPQALPRLEDATIDSRVLAFAVLASALSGILFGLVPALRRPGSRLLGGLVMAQLAISMVLLTGAGLLLRSLWQLESVPLGMQTGRVLTARFVLGKQRYGGNPEMLEFFRQLEQRLASVPGVESAAITDSLPPSGGTRGRPLSTIEIAGKPRRPEGTGGMVAWRYITPGYFAALGIPLLRGRGFNQTDRGLNGYSIILSAALAHKMFPTEDPIGQQILPGPNGQWGTVIGVAADVTNLGPAQPGQPEFYLLRKPSEDFLFRNQEPPTGWRAGVAVVRTAIDPNLVAGQLRSLLAGMDPTLPIEIQTMDRRLEDVTARPRFHAVLLIVFALMGVLLAAIGLFGVMSFVVAQRRREMGIRLALGATRAHIFGLTLRNAARWTAGGLAIGAIASIAAARGLRSLLFQVQPADPAVIAATLAVLCMVALLAASGPARSAAGVDPMETLRDE